MRTVCAFLLAVCAAIPVLAKDKPLDIYFIDVEGGQATLFVTPDKESMLVDAGWPGMNLRDAKRIFETAKKAGVKKIDYMVMTHYHRDHVGGVPDLAGLMPIVTYVDHGPNRETGKGAQELTDSYEEVAAKGKRLHVKAGDTIPVKGLTINVVSADGELIPQPLAGGGKANPVCGKEPKRDPDPSENARSLGMMINYGKFRIIDLGDLTWNKELELACPANKLGEVDVYLTTHHGMNMSGPAAIVHALNPRVAIMNNGAKKGGTPEAWKVVSASPRLEDLWQLHFAFAGGKETNVPDVRIANLEEQCAGNNIKLSAMPDGSFSVHNFRNKYTKEYPAKK